MTYVPNRMRLRRLGTIACLLVTITFQTLSASLASSPQPQGLGDYYFKKLTSNEDFVIMDNADNELGAASAALKRSLTNQLNDWDPVLDFNDNDLPNLYQGTDIPETGMHVIYHFPDGTVESYTLDNDRSKLNEMKTSINTILTSFEAEDEFDDEFLRTAYLNMMLAIKFNMELKVCVRLYLEVVHKRTRDANIPLLMYEEVDRKLKSAMQEWNAIWNDKDNGLKRGLTDLHDIRIRPDSHDLLDLAQSILFKEKLGKHDGGDLIVGIWREPQYTPDEFWREWRRMSGWVRKLRDKRKVERVRDQGSD
eukprot:GHVU01235372.1.p1 GENE.GHVU01235372.1~~GHVU01235372.1.p1  ORF type:complete len:308 (+),score=40.21 GHVU01235372.1:122-1045(+)